MSKVLIDKEEITRLILEGKTIPELQKYFNCGRTVITDYKRKHGLVGLSPNSKKFDRESGFKICNICSRELPLVDFYSNGKTPSGKTKYKPSCKICENTKSRDNHYKIIEEYLAFKNKSYKCEFCSTTGPYGFLDFHHKEPSKKLFTIGRTHMQTMTHELFQELEKCLLLCPNCHKKEHLIMGPI